MKQSKNLILTLLCFFAIHSFAQNVTSVDDLGATIKSNGNNSNYLCQANIESYHTIKENRSALSGVNIDVYNLTTETEELSLKNHPLNKFSFNFKHGNKYVVMLRKEGYLVKRILAKIGVEGCIACFEGLNTLTPLNEQEVNSIANMKIMMRKFNEGDRILIPEIEFEGKSADLNEKTQKTLNDLAQFFKDNSNILGQLELHTDARGDANENLKLSNERAKVVMNYLALSGVSKDDISIKGYGERKIVNHCIDGVNCGETQHSKNRRALFWLRASIGENSIFNESLASILQKEGTTLASVDEARQPTFSAAVPQEPIEPEPIIQEEEEEIIVEAPKKEEVQAEANLQQEEKSKALAKVDQAIPKTDANHVFSSSFNNIDVDDEKAKLCDVNGVPINSEKRMMDFEPINKDGDGVIISKNVKGKVTHSGSMSKTTVVTYTEEGDKDVRRSGRATLVPNTFTGYKVELFTSVDELDNSHSIFKRYGMVYLDDTGVAFSYMIGEFQGEEAAAKFLRTVIKPLYPEAKVIRYKNGKRKE